MLDGIDHLSWRKSSRPCGNGACVEVARTTNSVFLRDSEDPTGPLLAFSKGEWAAFVCGIKAGDFEAPADPA